MYELSRVRLYSVGPPGARYEDVTIDLSKAGDVVQHPQLALLDEVSLRRPSPASVLFLENGGGKSVLIKLIFSVMLPGKRQIVGTSSTRVLEKFVGRGDVAHVVLEWMHTETGRLLITGKVAEWSRNHSADNGLVETWYSFRPGATVGMKSLPFAEDNHNLVAAEYRARLADLYDVDSTLDLFWADRHNKWAERLASLGLDPELFEFQRRMNAGEGEAADAFTFATDEALVDFLLKAVLSGDDTADLATSLSEYASTLSKRDILECERDFVSAVLDRLGPLGQLHDAAEAAHRHCLVTETEAGRLTAAVRARFRGDGEQLAEQEKLVTGQRELLDKVEEERATAERVHAELGRCIASFRLDQARTDHDRAKTGVREADRRVVTWQATEPTIEWMTKDQAAKQLRELLQEKQEVETAALHARDARAHALVRSLLDMVDKAHAEVKEHEGEVQRLDTEVQEIQATWDKAVAAAAEATATAHHLDRSVAQVHTEVDEAAREGLVPSWEAVPATAEALAAAVRLAETAETAARDRCRQLEKDVEAAHTARSEALKTEASAKARHDKAKDALARADADAAALASNERLTELIEGTQVMLELDAETLISQLTAALGEVDRTRVGLGVDEAADARARHALDSAVDALLPPPPEVEDLVGLLRGQGILCHSGWEVLADFPDETKRRELVRRLPHLAAGVLLNNPADLARAQQVVADHGFAPTSIVAVASTQSFEVVTAQRFDLQPQGDAGFIAPLQSALYDHDAARVESARINERHAERRGQLDALNTRFNTDHRLRARLEEWRATYPRGRYAELTDQVTTAKSDLDSARRDLDLRTTELDARKHALDDARRDLDKRIRIVAHNRDRAAQVARLRDRIDAATGWIREANTARSTAQAEKERAEGLRKQRDRVSFASREHQRRADQHRATAAQLSEEITNAGGGADVDKSAPVPSEPVAVLRGLLRDAESAFHKAQVGSDLLLEVDAADNAASRAWKAVDDLPAAIRKGAEALLGTPAGADAASRAAALDQAKRTQAASVVARDAAHEELIRQETRYSDLPVPEPPVVLPEAPVDIDRARQLLTEAQATLANAETRVRTAKSDHDSVAAVLARLKEEVAAFDRVVAIIAGGGDETKASDFGDILPFSGDAVEAEERYTALRKRLRDVRKERDRAASQLRASALEVFQTANAPQFQELVSAVRTQITTVPVDELPKYAAPWADNLRPRLIALSDELAQSARHRMIIIERLRAMVENALRVLRQAQRLSRLPTNLGDWSGQEFLRIGFTPAEGDVLTQQLAQVIDDAAGGVASKRDGTSILLRGVRAAVPKGFKVTMLKPDAALRSERVRISEVRDVFSGGQHLTAAIILYCTLAALRANDQGHVRRRHAGVLFLDNPIGRASASYLLDLQRSVAAALGVQLVYTTGLFDAEALGAFPLIVRLRNDADLRAGRKYLSIEDEIRQALNRLAEPGDMATVTSTRVLLRERRRDDES